MIDRSGNVIPVLADVMVPSNRPVMLVRPGYTPTMDTQAVIHKYIQDARQEIARNPRPVLRPSMPVKRPAGSGTTKPGGGTTKPGGDNTTKPGNPITLPDLNLGEDVIIPKLNLSWGTSSDTRLSPTPAPIVDNATLPTSGPNIPDIHALGSWTYKDLEYSPQERGNWEAFLGTTVAPSVLGATFKAVPAAKALYQGIRNASFSRLMKAMMDSWKGIKPLPQTPIPGNYPLPQQSYYNLGGI